MKQTCKHLCICLFSLIYKADAEVLCLPFLYHSFALKSGSHLPYFLIPNPFIYVSILKALSSSSSSTANLRLIFPKEPTADKLLKLLLPSLKFLDLHDFRGFEQLMSQSISWSTLSLATTNLTMLLLQKGQTGTFVQEFVGFGLLWQHKARVHCAHILCPQS